MMVKRERNGGRRSDLPLFFVGGIPLLLNTSCNILEKTYCIKGEERERKGKKEGMRK
jgi:hypothetical protein